MDNFGKFDINQFEGRNFDTKLENKKRFINDLVFARLGVDESKIESTEHLLDAKTSEKQAVYLKIMANDVNNYDSFIETKVV